MLPQGLATVTGANISQTLTGRKILRSENCGLLPGRQAQHYVASWEERDSDFWKFSHTRGKNWWDNLTSDAQILNDLFPKALNIIEVY